MKSVKYITSLLFLALTALLVAACGGGGGGGDDTVPTAPSTPVSITGSNAELISADVLYWAEILGGFSLADDVLPTEPAPGVQVDVNSSKFNYPSFIMQQLQQLSAQSISSNNVNVSGILISDVPKSYDCQISGTYRIYGDVAVGAPDWIPAEGDQITITYSKCEDLEGVVLNGTISIAITALDLLDDSTLMDLHVVMTVLSVGFGGEVVNADGDMQMIIAEFDSGDMALYLGGEKFTVWADSEVETLKNYSYDYFEEFTGFDPNYSYLMDGTLDSTVIGGSVSFLMTDPIVPFTGIGVPFENAENYPSAGDLLITTSADTSSVKITVNNSIEVWIDVYSGDANVGDIPTTWEHLDLCLSDPAECYSL